MCWVENEDVVGAAPTGDAPTTSEWSTILLPTKVRLILETLRYIHLWQMVVCNYLSMLNVNEVKTWMSNYPPHKTMDIIIYPGHYLSETMLVKEAPRGEIMSVAFTKLRQSPGLFDLLTYWGRDEMNNILQATFSNVYSSMKMFEFRLRFHWSLFPRVQLTIFQHWFR